MPERCILYYITDRTAFAEDESVRRRHVLEKIAEAARAGIDYIQLREKDLSTRELELLAGEAVGIITKLRTENRELRTKLLINSRIEVALAANADGIHLRSTDISPQDVRTIWKCSEGLHEKGSCGEGPCGAGTPARQLSPQDPLIAASCHSPAEVAQASANAVTFAVFSPVFEKKDSHPTGLSQLREACQLNIPVLALGGITLSNAESCIDVGASGIAAIRLFQENKIAEVVKHLRA